jgi:Tfp pilus assembly protein PilV
MKNNLFFPGKKIFKNTMHRRSFSLMEVVVGAVIIALVFGGFTAVFINVRHYVFHANRRVVATNLSRETLNTLYVGVTADPNDPLAVRLAAGNHNVNNVNIDNINYNGTYIVAAGPGNSQYQQVTIRINYPLD